MRAMRVHDSDDSTPSHARKRAGAARAKVPRHTLLVILVGALLPVSILAGDASRCEPSPKEQRRVVRVRVVDQDHPNRGVANARVDVWELTRVPVGRGMPPSDSLPHGQAQTNAKGWATLGRITRRAAYLQVRASGFTMARRTLPPAGRAETELKVGLARGTVVSGTVRKADGTPAVGVRVRAEQPQQWGWTQESPEVVTDNQGRFNLTGVFPGRVTLRAMLREGDAVWASKATAEAGSVSAGVRLPAEPTRRRLRLLVKGPDGVPVAYARCQEEAGSFRQHRIRRGELVLAADPEVQWVSISRPQAEDYKALPWAPVLVGPLGPRGGDLEVVLPKGRTVLGTVRDEQGRPLGGVMVLAMPLFPAGGAVPERPAMGWSDSSTDAQGHFRIQVPHGGVEIQPYMTGWSAEPIRVGESVGRLELTMRRIRRLRGFVRHEDGTPAPKAVLYALGLDTERERWTRVSVERDGKGNFSMSAAGSRVVRLRAGLSPSGVEDMTASEVAVKLGVDTEPIVLTVPRSRTLLVRIPKWPTSAVGVARIANGPNSPGALEWIVDGTVRFDGIDPRAHLSVYCGPLSDGRIAFARDVSKVGAVVRLPLVTSRTIRGRVRGLPSDAQPDSVWADTSAFEARGRMDPDGSFLIRGVPPEACRVCVVFKRGKEMWAGSVVDKGAGALVEIAVRRMEKGAFAAWIASRPLHP